jgi:hypothetical protein
MAFSGFREIAGSFADITLVGRSGKDAISSHEG